MTASPNISVVMGVYNGAENLRDTVQSVLSQEGVDLEFVIVDDGSTDSTPVLLEEIARTDRRVRVARQSNLGLTRALICGCAEARGEFIARQDCGDLSLPGRLLTQIRTMESHPDATLMSCGTRFVGPQDEPLYDVTIGEDVATAGLMTLELKRLRGPAHHGCTLFRRDLYERVGGYREEFYFAQDLDLWSRLVEHGPHIAVSGLFYQAGFSPASISSLQRPGQVECAEILLECASLRRVNQSESAALARARMVLPGVQKATARDLASALYFVGTCLHKRGDARARRYFRDALRANPFHLKSALRLLWNQGR